MNHLQHLFKRIKRMIDCKTVRIVSFDIFDTLLVRPSIFHRDILRLVAWSIQDDFSVDVEQDRLAALHEMDQPFATLSDIWLHIARKKGYGAELAEKMATREMEIEGQLLYQRQFGKQLYDYAISKGKRVIAVSDMHIPGKMLEQFLIKNGFDGIGHVYVSCDYQAGKQTGELFDCVLREENISKVGRMVHIGDSFKSDFISPTRKGIRAVHMPKNTELFVKLYCGERIMKSFRDNTYENIIYGFAINELFEEGFNASQCFTLREYVILIAFPMLLHTAMFTLHNSEIQDSGKYRFIYFVSRDGYLSLRAYSFLRSFYGNKRLEGRYLYASRIACRCLTEVDALDSIDARFIPDCCTLKSFLGPTFLDGDLKQRIYSELSEETLALEVKTNREKCRDILSDYHQELQKDHNRKIAATKQYYSEVISNVDFALLADCGYCGTIPAYLFRGFDGKIRFDKLFLWENEKNQLLDDVNGTKTYTVFKEKKGSCMGALVESTFSERNGSCIGFKSVPGGNVEPIFEEFICSEAMKKDHTFIQDSAQHLIEQFGNLFQHNLRLLRVGEFQTVMDIIMFYLTEDNLNTPEIFNNIRFQETYSNQGERASLGEMMVKRNHTKHKTLLQKYMIKGRRSQ